MSELEIPEPTVDSVWRDTDPRFPNRRVQILAADPDEYFGVTAQTISSDGHPMSGHLFRETWSRFLPGAAYRPDDSGWPAPYRAMNGRFELLEPPEGDFSEDPD